MKKVIKMEGLASTCSVMDWIEESGCPDLDCAHFEFPDDPILGGYFKGIPRSFVVSRQNPDSLTLELHPVETWHKIKDTQRRLTCDHFGWYACIKGVFYWMTT